MNSCNYGVSLGGADTILSGNILLRLQHWFLEILPCNMAVFENRSNHHDHDIGLVQERWNSNVLAMESHLSCNKALMYKSVCCVKCILHEKPVTFLASINSCVIEYIFKNTQKIYFQLSFSSWGIVHICAKSYIFLCCLQTAPNNNCQCIFCERGAVSICHAERSGLWFEAVWSGRLSSHLVVFSDKSIKTRSQY